MKENVFKGETMVHSVKSSYKINKDANCKLSTRFDQKVNRKHHKCSVCVEMEWTEQRKEGKRWKRGGWFLLKQLNWQREQKRWKVVCISGTRAGGEFWKFFGKFCLACGWRASNVEEWVGSFSPDHRPSSYNRRLERPAVKRFTLWFTRWTKGEWTGSQCPAAQGLLSLAVRVTAFHSLHNVCKCFSRPDVPVAQFWIEFRAYSAKFLKSAFNCKSYMYKWMVMHPGILAWRVPWTEGPGELQPMG